MEHCEETIKKAYKLILEELIGFISENTLNEEGCYLKIVFNNGTIL
ncbi:MAG: hypothetical protein ACTSYA_05305 [Candidatus Kariarchaeaceae archaeon]